MPRRNPIDLILRDVPMTPPHFSVGRELGTLRCTKRLEQVASDESCRSGERLTRVRQICDGDGVS